MNYIKSYNQFEQTNEGIIHNVVLSSLLSLGVLSGYSSVPDSVKTEIVQKSQDDDHIVDTLSFLSENNIKLDKKYNLSEIRDLYNDQYQDFELVLPKLTPKFSPISASVFTFNMKGMGLINIPIADVKLDISDNLVISFWDSGWTRQGNMVGVSFTKKF